MSAGNDYEQPIDPKRLCFYCPNPATVERRVALTSEYAFGPNDDRLALILEGKAAPVRGAIEVVADACNEHEAILSEAMFRHFDVGGLDGQSLTQSTCPDPWHTDDDAYEGSEAPPQDIGGGWSVSYFRCPTCGQASFSSTECPPDIESDPAYRFAREAFAQMRTE